MPRRDINIFNLSMMDVISGAMGAFLIIMVILMRYYKEDADVTAQREAAQKQIDDIQRQIDEAIKQLQDTTDIDVAELLRRLEEVKRQLADARREVTRLSNDLQAARNRVNQLQAQNEELQRENEILKRRVELNEPFVVQADWTSAVPVDVDVHIESSIQSDKNEILAFDPRVRYLPMFRGDMRVDDDSFSGPDVWVINGTRSGATYKIFVYMHAPPPTHPDTRVSTLYATGRFKVSLETVTLSGSKSWEFVGLLRTEESGRTIVVPTSDADRARIRAEVEARISRPLKEDP